LFVVCLRFDFDDDTARLALICCGVGDLTGGRMCVCVCCWLVHLVFSTTTTTTTTTTLASLLILFYVLFSLEVGGRKGKNDNIESYDESVIIVECVPES
jgi:hypothetical protein